MANRIKDIAVTATSTAGDDYIVIDGSANGTRKILASSALAGVTSVAGRTGAVTLSTADVSGLGTSAALNAGSANGVATLDASGKLTSSQIPNLSVVTYLGVVASEAAMLALTGQEGDWCSRSDLGTNFIITGNNPTQLSSWTQLSYPTAPVTSVAGRTGAVTLSTSDIAGLGTIASQAASSVAITGGTIDGVAVGATTASTGRFTTVTTTGNITASGTISATSQVYVTSTYKTYYLYSNSGDGRLHIGAVGESDFVDILDSGLRVLPTTAATSTTSGALQVSGGIGVAGAGYFGGDIVRVSGSDFPSGGQFRGGNPSGTTTEILSAGNSSRRASLAVYNEGSGAILWKFSVNGTGAIGMQFTQYTSGVGTAVLDLFGTTEATVGGVGSLTTAGGIYAAKKIISNTDIVAGGNITVTGSLLTNSGSAAAPAISLNSTANGLFYSGSNVVRVAAGGAEVASMSSTAAIFVGAISASNLSGTNTGDQTITLTGHVTGSGTGSFATTIANGVVTNAMLAGSIDLTTKVTGTLPVANGGTGAATAPDARTNLGATTVGSSLFTLTNPTAITFLQVNADNTVSALDAATFRSAIGAGTSSTTGTVTSVSGTGTVSGLTLTGSVTSSGSLTLGGTLSVTASDFSSQTANTFLAAPNGSAGTPTFRTIVAADIPTLNQNTTGTAANVTGTVAVANGGTGATTLTGVVKGNGTSAFTAATAGTDYVAPATATTFTATQTFSGSTSTLASVLTNAAEVVTVSATAATGTITFDVTTQSVLYYTSNASGSWTMNFRASSGTSLNTAMAIGQSVTVVFMATNGSTAYRSTAVQVDGVSITPRWQGGSAPSTGNANSIDVYSYTIIKTANATFTVLASQTRFA